MILRFAISSRSHRTILNIDHSSLTIWHTAIVSHRDMFPYLPCPTHNSDTVHYQINIHWESDSSEQLTQVRDLPHISLTCWLIRWTCSRSWQHASPTGHNTHLIDNTLASHTSCSMTHHWTNILVRGEFKNRTADKYYFNKSSVPTGSFKS